MRPTLVAVAVAVVAWLSWPQPTVAAARRTTPSAAHTPTTLSVHLCSVPPPDPKALKLPEISCR